MFKSNVTFTDKIKNFFSASKNAASPGLAKNLKNVKNVLLIVCMSVYLVDKLKKRKPKCN